MMMFDEPSYIKINEARWEAAEKILYDIKTHKEWDISTCIDVGCGPGWFSDKLVSHGFKTIGIDGKKELIEIARLRAEEADFLTMNVENRDETLKLEPADLVFCFGLLYHLENPFVAIRNLAFLTKKALLIEMIVIPSDNPITWLVDEGNNETQGLTYHALIPSRSCLTKMLYCAGFKFVYEFNGVIDHEDFQETEFKYRRRRVFLASRDSIELRNFSFFPENKTPKYQFSKNLK